MSRVLPILFNSEMVRAILDGRKTVTRRVMKIQPWGECDNGEEHELKNIFKDEPKEFCCKQCGQGVGPSGHSLFKAPYQEGDILYVRETWSPVFAKPKRYLYKVGCEEADNLPIKWHPSIHMPKEAARIWLKVTNVRAERLQEMTASESAKEGIRLPKEYDTKERAYILEFADLWDSTIKKSDLPLYGWEANPWVWVIEFERCERPKEL